MEIIIPATIGPPKFVCRICGEPFWADEQHVRHLLRCYRRNEAEVQSTNPKHIMPGFYGPEAGDPELADYWRRNPPKD